MFSMADDSSWVSTPDWLSPRTCDAAVADPVERTV